MVLVTKINQINKLCPFMLRNINVGFNHLKHHSPFKDEIYHANKSMILFLGNVIPFLQSPNIKPFTGKIIRSLTFATLQGLIANFGIIVHIVIVSFERAFHSNVNFVGGLFLLCWNISSNQILVKLK